MKISFVTIGRFKSGACQELVSHYLKLANRFATVEHIELPEKDGQDQALLKWLEKRGSRPFLTLMDEKGKHFASRALATQVERIKDGSFSEWVIAVGGAHGYGSEVKGKSQLLWSLSELTFPHELASAVAAEQVFRSLSILNRHPYHNE